MGTCRYCGQPAGFLRKEHRECRIDHDRAGEKIRSMVTGAYRDSSTDLAVLYAKLVSLASDVHIDGEELSRLVYDAWSAAIDSALDDGLLSEAEERQLLNMVQAFQIGNSTALGSDPNIHRIAKAAILREVVGGTIPERIVISDAPFNLQKSEKLLWMYQGTEYYEMRTRRQYVGGYTGVSVRVMKGVYLRSGSFRGNPVETDVLTHIESGLFGISTKHIYFSGERKKFRIPYGKIVEFTPYEDGIGVQRDAQTAKPQIFKTGDGWFTNNLIRNLANLAK